MSDVADARKVVEVLRQEGLLTEEQTRRVLASVDGGRDLTWALSHLPLVEPLRFLRAQSLAGTNPISPGMPTPSLTPVPGDSGRVGAPLTPRTPGRSVSEIEEVSGKESIKTLELDLDTNYGMGFEQVGRPVHAPTPMGETAYRAPSPIPSITPAAVASPPPAAASPTPPAAAAGSGEPPLMDEPMLDPAAYQRPGIVAATYDLADDEGIPLVRRVNALLTEAVEEGVRMMDIYPEGDEFITLFRSEIGGGGRSRSHPSDEAIRIGNRLKVMARIEPWRKPPQKGTFNILLNKRHHRVFINILPWPGNPETQRTVVHIL
jgi:hypothetical protein